MRTILLLILGVCIASANLFAQNLDTVSKKARKHYDAAYNLYQQKNYNEAIQSFSEALRVESNFVEAELLRAEAYFALQKLNEAKEGYKRVIALNDNFFPAVYYSLSDLCYRRGEYTEGLSYIQHYQTTFKLSQIMATKANKLSERLQTALTLWQDSLSFSPKKLAIDFPYDAYRPILSLDGTVMSFTALLPKDSTNKAVFGNRHEDFYFTYLTDSVWSKPINPGAPLNSTDNEGAQTLSADAKTMYFTACNRADSKGGCDLYVSHLRNGKWTKAVNIGANFNTSAKETQPSLSADGKELYFVSNRKGGKGGMDLYVSTWNGTAWSIPRNISELNTEGDESSPFIHPDGQSLYFASDDLMGLGGYDIYVSRRDSTGKWGKSVNLGYPINTFRNEEGLILNAKGDKAYYSSDRGDTNIREIYEFELPLQHRPIPTSFAQLIVKDSLTRAVVAAQIRIRDVNTAQEISFCETNAKAGSCLIPLPSERDYAISVHSQGYHYHAERYFMTNGYEAPIHKTIYLNKIQSGDKVALNHIYFEYNSATLKDSSKVELQQIVDFMHDNPNLRIRILGHTDNQGNSNYNLKLSQDRARSVANYLISTGVDIKRINYTGYGSSQPIGSNATEEGRKRNRRVEMEVE